MSQHFNMVEDTLNMEGDMSAQNADRQWFEAFFRENFVSLCTFCQYKFRFDLDQSKEIVHIAFVKMWENLSTIDKETAKGFLITTIKNSSLDLLKHEKVKAKYLQSSETIPNPLDSPVILQELDARQLASDIDAAIAELPDQMRKIFLLSRNEGLTYSAIARQLDISIKTVETQMSRALVKIRKKLAHYLPTLIHFFSWIFF